MDWIKALNRSPLHGSFMTMVETPISRAARTENVLGQERLTAPLLSRQQDARQRRRRWWTVTNAAAASGAKRVQYPLGLPLGIPVELLAGQVKGENLLQVILAFMPIFIRASLMERRLSTVARVRQNWDGARFDGTILWLCRRALSHDRSPWPIRLRFLLVKCIHRFLLLLAGL
jgi:hypothetical protein